MKYYLFLFCIFISCHISYGYDLIIPEIDITNYPELKQMAVQAIAKTDSVLGRHSKWHDILSFKDKAGDGCIVLFCGSFRSDLVFFYDDYEDIENIKGSSWGYFKVSDVYFFLNHDVKKDFPNLKSKGHYRKFKLSKFEGQRKFSDKEFDLTWAFYLNNKTFLFINPQNKVKK